MGDSSNHPGTITGPGVSTVMIGGLPAAVVGDNHSCALPPQAGPHSPTVIVKGSFTVYVGGLPAARMGDTVGCGATIVRGASNVLIGG